MIFIGFSFIIAVNSGINQVNIQSTSHKNSDFYFLNYIKKHKLRIIAYNKKSRLFSCSEKSA